MKYSFTEYMADVKSQLTCNNKPDCVIITYNYTELLVDSHPDYFKQCLRNGLSAYKALLFFNDIL